MAFRLDPKDAAKLLRGKVPAATVRAILEQPTTKRHKYGARRTALHGRTFDSSGEAGRYGELRMMQTAGLITDLDCQFVFELRVLDVRSGELVKIGQYRADFVYRVVGSGERVIEDYKHEQTRTEAYMLRKKHVEAQYGVTIVEVGHGLKRRIK